MYNKSKPQQKRQVRERDIERMYWRGGRVDQHKPKTNIGDATDRECDDCLGKQKSTPPLPTGTFRQEKTPKNVFSSKNPTLAVRVAFHDHQIYM